MHRLDTPESIHDLIEKWGFLPFFRNNIQGFSIEEHTSPDLWFGDAAGPWEWKGPVIRMGDCAYGKFFANKAGYISREWLPDFLNYRRDGYDFDSRYECGKASHKDLNIYDTVSRYGTILSKKLKSLCGFTKAGGEKGFDGAVTRLQMQGYICISDFEYMIDKHGNRYGWGVARYSTPEELFGCDFTSSAYSRDPLESRDRIISHLKTLFPSAQDADILKIIK